jgi:glycosyltransferase involved in cell wall biosynthesis
MRILLTLTYYAPHVSGLTTHARRLAEGLAARGHRVTVLAARHRRNLPLREELGGVQVVRVPVAWRVSKGSVMPTYLPTLLPLLQAAEVVAINLPSGPTETLLLPLLARLLPRRPVVATYHCDVELPGGAASQLLNRALRLANLLGAALVRRVVAYTRDYAEASPVLRRFPHKLEVIPPPVDIPHPDPQAVAALRHRVAPGGEVIVGLACRLAHEKGIDYLLHALPLLEERLGPVKVAFAGQEAGVIGEDRYYRQLQPLLAGAHQRWVPLGVLDPVQLAAFYAACHVTVLPSVNRTESFGLVQVESMLCGTPVVATDLPGVRVPVRSTGMGLIVPPRDPLSLAAAIAQVVTDRARYVKPRRVVAGHFSLAESLSRYEALLSRLCCSRDRQR